MESLGTFGEFGAATHWLGRLAFVLALGLTGYLERTQFRLRFLESRTWWASNGRDVLNAVAFAALFSTALLIGFSGPIALLLAGTVVVLMNMLQSALGLRRGATLTSILFSLGLGMPVVIAPRWVDGAVRRSFELLF